MKLCVLFPGIGYTVDKPLLYYSKKLAMSKGYEIREVSYHDLPKNIRDDEEKKLLTYRMAYEQACECLGDVEWNDYSDIVFIGKSIGTIVSAALVESIEYSGSIRFLYMTPLAQTFKYAKSESGIVFTGLSDPWIVPDEIEMSAKKLCLPCYQYDGANHSLETNDALRNIDILKEVIKIVDEAI